MTTPVPEYADLSLPLAQRYQSAAKYIEGEKKKQADAAAKLKLEADAAAKKKEEEEAEEKKKQEVAIVARNVEIAKKMREWFPKFIETLMVDSAVQASIVSTFNQKLEKQTLVPFNHAQWMTKLGYDITPDELQSFMQTNSVEFAHTCTVPKHQFNNCKLSLGYNKEKKQINLVVDIIDPQSSYCLVM